MLNTYLITCRHTPNDHRSDARTRLLSVFEAHGVSATIENVWTFGAPKATVKMAVSEVDKLAKSDYIQNICKQ